MKRFFKRFLVRDRSRIRTFKSVGKRLLNLFLGQIYNLLVHYCSWWPLTGFACNEKQNSYREKHLAYHLNHFPALSETFIHREISALRKFGLHVEVFANKSDELDDLDDEARSLMATTYYLQPINIVQLSKYRKYFFLQSPLLMLNIFIYIVTHQYGETKTFKTDCEVFNDTVYLAGLLRNRKINHLHTPWVSRSTLSPMLSAHLIGIPYSVQGRASDIHRHANQPGLATKLVNAAFIITNSRFNESYLKSLLNHHDDVKIHVIYNGLDLEKFKPERKNENGSAITRILCVARLIEPKGLEYLLNACRILKDRGYSFRCEIIGGPQKPLDDEYYYHLKQLHLTLGLDDRVCFLGRQPFQLVLEKYKSVDLFVLPCVRAKNGSQDITPNSLIEAMAMGLPVISTRRTAIPEIVEDGVSGILVPPGDLDSLVDSMMRLIADKHLRRKLGENARKRIEEKFNVSENIVRYVELFNGV